ncbi:MAG TPA: TonB-dependent receptor, partial [Longimicrobiales bacterium]
MMRTLLRGLLAASIALPLAYPAEAAGQGRLVQAPQGGLQAIHDAADPLQRPVTVDALNAPLGEVLAQISTQADLALIYGTDIVPVDRRVTVRFREMPAGDALRRVLAGLDIDITHAGRSQVVLAKRERPAERAAPAQETGRVAGRVTEEGTGNPIAAAEVWLAGTSWRALTGADGRFLIDRVTPGEYTLRVRRIGYEDASLTIRVERDQTTFVDFALASAPTQLDAVVVTVTGQQRIRELGHVVGRVDADAVVRTGPVSSVSELLNARIPGVNVFNTSGTVGGEVMVRVRSPNSVQLTSFPIVIVDGVRYNSFQEITNGVTPFLIEPTSRFNDLNPNDIESIEVVKGPSATALYGTDAANGVIVIKTKIGQPGPARWRAYARAGITEMPDPKTPEIYWGWTSGAASCTLRNVSLGTCTQDSVTVIPNPFDDPDLTIFGSAPRWEYGLNVSGGSELLRYYFSADFDEATGPIQFPPALAKQWREERGAKLPTEHLEPNREERLNLRANMVAVLGDAATVRVNAAYTEGDTRNISLDNPFTRWPEQGRPDEEDPYGGQSPLNVFTRSSTETVNRFTGSASAEWRPTTWLETRAMIGLDLPSTYRYTLAPRDMVRNYTGAVYEIRSRVQSTSAELGATATFEFGRILSRTSVGAQYVRHHRNELTASGTNLRPGGASVIDAASQSLSQSYSETVTLGSYVEQMFGLNDRLFLTAALRADGASTFGNPYDPALYPRAGVSWVVSEEPFVPRVPGLDNLRLRYSYGAAGQQPTPGMRRMAFQSLNVNLEGQTNPAVITIRLPSPDLRPEKVKEHEFGFDASALEGRLQLDLTWNRRKTVDQITTINLPRGLRNVYANIGLIEGEGFEARLVGRVLDREDVSLDVIFNHSASTNKVVELGGQNPVYGTATSLVEGFPLGARFMVPIVSFEDANGDGIIGADEVVMGDSAVYMGKGTPGNTQSLTAALGLFRRRVRLSALFERRGDFMQVDQISYYGRTKLRAAVDPTAPLEEQAKVIATYLGAP